MFEEINDGSERSEVRASKDLIAILLKCSSSFLNLHCLCYVENITITSSPLLSPSLSFSYMYLARPSSPSRIPMSSCFGGNSGTTSPKRRACDIQINNNEINTKHKTTKNIKINKHIKDISK